MVYWPYTMVYWPVYHGILVVYWWYTGGILVAYHQYSTNAFTGLDQGFCFHMVVQLKFFSMSVSRLLCITLPCIALHCITLFCLKRVLI